MLARAQARLDELIGLDEPKEQIAVSRTEIQIDQLLAAQGEETSSTNENHIVLEGSPGTAKTRTPHPAVRESPLRPFLLGPGLGIAHGLARLGHRVAHPGFVRTLRSRPQRNPVRLTSYAATTRMRRSRSNVLHSARGSAYAAGHQHSLPPHTRKVAGSKKIFDWNLAADQASILNAFQVLGDYLEDMIARRRRTLTDDLISELIRGEDDGEKLDHDELLSLAVALLGTGTDTTRHQRPPAWTFSAIIPTNGRCSISSNSFLTRWGSHALPTYRLRPASHRHRIPRAGGGPHPGRNDRVCQHGSR